MFHRYLTWGTLHELRERRILGFCEKNVETTLFSSNTENIVNIMVSKANKVVNQGNNVVSQGNKLFTQGNKVVS